MNLDADVIGSHLLVKAYSGNADVHVAVQSMLGAQEGCGNIIRNDQFRPGLAHGAFLSNAL